MKQIKTIIRRRDYVEQFDTEVNAALVKGWVLVRRYITEGYGFVGAATVFYPCLVAELERENAL